MRIPTAHVFRALARTWARARTQRKRFKLDREISARFLLNQHGDLYFNRIILVCKLSS